MKKGTSAPVVPFCKGSGKWRGHLPALRRPLHLQALQHARKQTIQNWILQVLGGQPLHIE